MADEKKPKGEQAQAPKPRAEKSDKAAKGGKKSRGGEGGSSQERAAVVSTTAVVPPRLREKYRETIVPALVKQFQYKNPNQVPKLQKIVVNMGLGAAVANPKIIDTAVDEIKAMTGQTPVVTRSRKAIANFKLRAGLPIGAMVTLRSSRMWEFFDRLVTVALPRTRDFKGVSRKAFDGNGNYTLGLREQIIFPEINYDKLDAIKGVNISIVTTAKTDEEGRALLQQLGMPFRAT